MASIEKIVLRGGREDHRTWRERVGDAWRSIQLGPWNPRDPAIARYFGGTPVSAGVAVNEETALATSAFASAVFLIAWDIASLPLFHYKNLSGGGKERAGTRLNTLLHDQANPDTTAFDFRSALMMNALVAGNGYAEVERDVSGRPAALWNIEPHRVSVLQNGGGRQYRIAQHSGGEIIFSAADILHIKGPSYDSIHGFDTVRLARQALGLSIAAEQFGSTFFGNGSQLGGILSLTTALNAQARKNLSDTLTARHRGAENAHKWLMVEGDTKFTEVGIKPRDSQFIELRTFQIKEVARFFRIPPSMLADEPSTFANQEQEAIRYFKSCLRPWLVAVEQELSSKLINSLERNVQSIEHVVEGFLRADTEQRGAFYSAMLDRGVLSINDCRRLENLPPVDGGDVPRVAMNTQPLNGKE